jgi:hypothetical protein
MLRQFAAAWLVFFLFWGWWHGVVRGRVEWGLALAGLAVIGGVMGLAKPASLRWVFVGWMMVAYPIGWLISQVLLLILFYCMFTAVALLMRVRGRDALGLRPAPDQASFWLPKQTPLDVRRYFRQY